MSKIKNLLKSIDLTEKDTEVFLTLVKFGHMPIRKISEVSGVNRGSVYNSLKTLKEKGLVSFFFKEKNEHFVAENINTIESILEEKKEILEKSIEDFPKALREIKIMESTQERPVIKFYEGYLGIKNILEDVLYSTEKYLKKEYRVFSSSSISPYLYHPKCFPNFSEKRVEKNIKVKTIASGKGGALYGKDERRWLSKKEGSPTYKLIYAGKVAIISVGKNNVPHGLIIEDLNIYKSEMEIFDSLWESLS